MNRKKLIILSFIFILLFTVKVENVKAEAPECTSGTNCATRLFRTNNVIPYSENIGDWEAYKYKTLYRSNSSMPYNLVNGVKTLSIYNAFCIYPQKGSRAAIESSTNFGGVYYYNGKEITGQYGILQYFLYYGYEGPGWSTVLSQGPSQASQSGSPYGDVYNVYSTLCTNFGSNSSGTGINKCNDDDLYVVTHNILSYISYQENLEGHGRLGDGRYNSTVTGSNLTTRFASKISEIYTTYIGRHSDSTNHPTTDHPEGTFFVYYLDNGNNYQDYIYWLDIKEMRDHPYINVLKYIDGSFPSRPTQKFKFGLYSDSNCTNLIRTQETGIVGDSDEVTRPWGRTIFIDLQRNTNYWVKELDVPSGYRDSTGCSPVNPIGETSGSSINYNNTTGTPSYGAIEFQKTFDRSDSTYNNTNTYRYKYAVTTSGGVSKGDVYSDANGIVKYGYNGSTKTLDLNTSYNFCEYVDNNGYAKVYNASGTELGSSDYKPVSRCVIFEVEENPSSDGLESFSNKLEEKYCVKVQKKDQNTNEVVNDASTRFRLFSDANCSTAVGSAVSLTNGVVTFTGLDNQPYYVKETVAPTGYSLNNTCTKINTGELIRQGTDGSCTGNATKAITNTPLYISFYKVREDGTTPLAGTKFKVKTGNNYITVSARASDYNNCYVYTGTNSTGTEMIADATGHICVVKVPNNVNYVAEETEPGETGYIFENGTINLVIGTDVQGKESSNSLINKPYVIQLIKKKEGNVDWYNTSDNLGATKGAEFVIKDSNDRYITVKENKVTGIDGYNGCYVFNSYATNKTSASRLETSMTSVTNGVSKDEICVTGAPNESGIKYYAEEVATNNNGYYLDETPVEMTGPSAARQTTISKMENKPSVLSFFKTDENGNRTDVSLPSKFKVKATDKTGNNFIKSSSKTQVQGYNGCYIFEGWVNEENASELEAVTSDTGNVKAGEVCVIRASKEYTYEAIEIETQNEAYFIPTINKITGITTKNMVDAYSENAKQIKNRPYLLNFYKVNEDGDINEVLLNGATFNIYEGTKQIGWSGLEKYKDENNKEKTCYIYSEDANSNKTFTSGYSDGTNSLPKGEVCIVRVPKKNGTSDLTYRISEINPAIYHTFGTYSEITLSPTKTFQDKLPLSEGTKNKIINYETEFEFTKNVGATRSGITVTGSKEITVNGERVTLDQVTLAELKNIIFNIRKVGETTNLSFVKNSDGVYEFVQNVDGVSGQATQNLTVGNNYKIKVLHLEEGRYEILENNVGICESETDYTKCIGYYEQESTKQFEITDCSSPRSTSTVCNGRTGTVTSTMTNIPTEITFTKSDLYSYIDAGDTVKFENDEELRAFDDIVFKLKDENGNYLTLEKIGETGLCTIEGSTSVYRYVNGDNSDGESGTELHACGGHITITNLCRGKKYYIEEVRVPENSVFVLPDTHPEVQYKIPCSEGEITPEHDSTTAIITDTPTRVIFQKRDSKYGYLIADETTTFELYRCKKNTECHPSNANDQNGVLVKFSARGIIQGDNEDIGKEVYKFLTTSDEQNGSSGVSELHPYNAELILRYLPGGYEYVLLETKAPKGYSLPKGFNRETRFEVSTETVNVDVVDVPNKPTSLLIRKYADDENTLLEGAEFVIYEGTTCDPHLSAYAQPRKTNPIRLKTISEGIYEYRNDSDTSTVRTCTDTETGKCSGMTSTLTYEDYVDTWSNFENSENQRGERVEIRAGEALIQYLEYGHCYIIEETKAPKGYTLPKEEDRFIMVKIDEKDDVVDTFKELINKPTPYTFYKFDEKNNLIDGAEFKLQKLNKEQIYEDVTVTEYESIVERTEKGKYYKVDGNSTNTKITTKNGSATIFYLEEGQYRIVETKAPEGKELPSKQLNVATFYVDSIGNVTGSSIITNKPKTEKIEVKPEAQAELIVNISTGQQVVKYGLIIGVIVLAIFGLIYVQSKGKKK